MNTAFISHNSYYQTQDQVCWHQVVEIEFLSEEELKSFRSACSSLRNVVGCGEETFLGYSGEERMHN